MMSNRKKVTRTSPDNRFVRTDEKRGSGSFKQVWLGTDTDSGRDIAWNVVKTRRLSDEEKDSLRNETDMLATLNHRHIIDFYFQWETDFDEFIFITEIASATLKQYIDRLFPVKQHIIQRWCRQLLDALHFLHTHDPPVLHRDLKCDNILVDGAADGELRVADFGLSVMRSKGEGRTMLGTPGFMAWEMFKEEYTQLVDIFAFGMCVLEMVTNEYPYAECNGNPTAYMKKGQEIVHPDALKDVQNDEIKDLIVQCLLPESKRPTAEQLMQHPFITRQFPPRDHGRPLKPKNKSRNTMTRPPGPTSQNSMNNHTQPGQQQQPPSQPSSVEGIGGSDRAAAALPNELKQSNEGVPSVGASSSRPGSRRNSFEHPGRSRSPAMNPMSQSVPTAAYLPTSGGEGEQSASVLDSGYESGDRSGGYESAGAASNNGQPRSFCRRDLMRPPSSYVHRGGQSDASSLSSASAQPSSTSSSAHASPSQLSNGIGQAPHSGGAVAFGNGYGVPPNGTYVHQNSELKLPLDSLGALTAHQAYQLSAGAPLGALSPGSPPLGRSPSQSPPHSPRDGGGAARHHVVMPPSPRRAQEKVTFKERGGGHNNLSAAQQQQPPRKVSAESDQSVAFHRMARSRSIDAADPMSGDSFPIPSFDPNTPLNPPTFAEDINPPPVSGNGNPAKPSSLLPDQFAVPPPHDPASAAALAPDAQRQRKRSRGLSDPAVDVIGFLSVQCNATQNEGTVIFSIYEDNNLQMQRYYEIAKDTPNEFAAVVFPANKEAQRILSKLVKPKVKIYKESVEKTELDEAETDLTRLFLDLKIPNEYSEKFVDEEITKEDLIESIDKEQLKELIPKMGPRARLEKWLKTQRGGLQSEENQPTPPQTMQLQQPQQSVPSLSSGMQQQQQVPPRTKSPDLSQPMLVQQVSGIPKEQLQHQQLGDQPMQQQQQQQPPPSQGGQNYPAQNSPHPNANHQRGPSAGSFQVPQVTPDPNVAYQMEQQRMQQQQQRQYAMQQQQGVLSGAGAATSGARTGYVSAPASQHTAGTQLVQQPSHHPPMPQQQRVAPATLPHVHQTQHHQQQQQQQQPPHAGAGGGYVPQSQPTPPAGAHGHSGQPQQQLLQQQTSSRKRIQELQQSKTMPIPVRDIAEQSQGRRANTPQTTLRLGNQRVVGDGAPTEVSASKAGSSALPTVAEHRQTSIGQSQQARGAEQRQDAPGQPQQGTTPQHAPHLSHQPHPAQAQQQPPPPQQLSAVPLIRPNPVVAASGVLSDDEFMSGNESGDLIAHQRSGGGARQQQQQQQVPPSTSGNGQGTAPTSMNSNAFSRVGMSSGVMSGISSGGLSGISSGGLTGLSSGGMDGLSSMGSVGFQNPIVELRPTSPPLPGIGTQQGQPQQMTSGQSHQGDISNMSSPVASPIPIGGLDSCDIEGRRIQEQIQHQRNQLAALQAKQAELREQKRVQKQQQQQYFQPQPLPPAHPQASQQRQYQYYEAQEGQQHTNVYSSLNGASAASVFQHPGVSQPQQQAQGAAAAGNASQHTSPQPTLQRTTTLPQHNPGSPGAQHPHSVHSSRSQTTHVPMDPQVALQFAQFQQMQAAAQQVNMSQQPMHITGSNTSSPHHFVNTLPSNPLSPAQAHAHQLQQSFVNASLPPTHLAATSIQPITQQHAASFVAATAPAPAPAQQIHPMKTESDPSHAGSGAVSADPTSSGAEASASASGASSGAVAVLPDQEIINSLLASLAPDSEDALSKPSKKKRSQSASAPTGRSRPSSS